MAADSRKKEPLRWKKFIRDLPPEVQLALIIYEKTGMEKGWLSGKREALLMFLEARNLRMSLDQEDHIRACTRDETVDRWIRRAATASSVDEVLKVRSPKKTAAKQARPPASGRRGSRA